MPSELLHSPRVDTQTLVDASTNVSAGAASKLVTILGAMKALSESHRVLENLLIRAYHKSQTLPLSTDEKLSILFLVLFVAYSFVVYPFFTCPTADIPGPYLTATPLGFLIHNYHKSHDNADQRSLELHNIYGAVVRLSPTLVSVNDPALLPARRLAKPQYATSQAASITPSKENVREANSFGNVTSAVVDDLRIAMKGQKTVDIHEILSRHLKEQAPASFALALAHTIYQLSHPFHRHYLNRLARQLAADDPNEDSEVSGSAKLLDSVVKESLRMQQAPNHHSHRIMTAEDGTPLRDRSLPAGIGIHMSLYTVSRNSSVFMRPNDFNPGRWLGKEAFPEMDGALKFVLDY